MTSWGQPWNREMSDTEKNFPGVVAIIFYASKLLSPPISKKLDWPPWLSLMRVWLVIRRSLGQCRQWRPRTACPSMQSDQGLYCPLTIIGYYRMYWWRAKVQMILLCMLEGIFCLIWPKYGNNRSGPSCSKLTMSLVNDSLKFTSSDTQICWNFLLKKCE